MKAKNQAPTPAAKPTPMRFMAIDTFVEANIVKPTESELRGHEFVSWGDNNDYPDYLRDLVDTVPTLGSILRGCVDYCVGNDVVFAAGHGLRPDGTMNRKGDALIDIARKAFAYFWEDGWAPLEIILTQDLTAIAEVNVLDARYIRSNREGDMYWYSEKWNDKYSRKSKALIYPKWTPGCKHPKSILMMRNNTLGKVYPSPVYASAVTSCEAERKVSEYHLNAISNGFAASYMISMNNGDPGEEVRNEIEKGIREKFGGSENAGRIMVTFNESKAHDVTVQKLDIDDFGVKYQSLKENARSEIFAAFRAAPNLFGLPTATGFSNEEYEAAFRLFNRTMIRPVQELFKDTMDRIYGVKNSVDIHPFTMEV